MNEISKLSANAVEILISDEKFARPKILEVAVATPNAYAKFWRDKQSIVVFLILANFCCLFSICMFVYVGTS